MSFDGMAFTNVKYPCKIREMGGFLWKFQVKNRDKWYEKSVNKTETLFL